MICWRRNLATSLSLSSLAFGSPDPFAPLIRLSYLPGPFLLCSVLRSVSPKLPAALDIIPLMSSLPQIAGCLGFFPALTSASPRLHRMP